MHNIKTLFLFSLLGLLAYTSPLDIAIRISDVVSSHYVVSLANDVATPN